MNSRCDCIPACERRLWCILLCAVHMATRPSNPEKSATRGFLKLGCQIWQPLRRGVWSSRGKEQHAHTQRVLSNSQNPSALLPFQLQPYTHSVRPSLPPWQRPWRFTRVKLILSGAGWVAGTQTGRREATVSRDAINLYQNSPFRCD